MPALFLRRLHLAARVQDLWMPFGVEETVKDSTAVRIAVFVCVLSAAFNAWLTWGKVIQVHFGEPVSYPVTRPYIATNY